MSDENKPVLGGIAFGPVSGLLGMRVRESEAIPADMVVMVRNGETFQRFTMGVNTLADQEREIERLRASLAAAEHDLNGEGGIVATLHVREQIAQGERRAAEQARDAALQRAEEAERQRDGLRASFEEAHAKWMRAEDVIEREHEKQRAIKARGAEWMLRAEASEATLRRVEALAEEWEELPSGFPPGHIMEPFAQAAARDLRAALSSTPDKKEPTP